MELAGKHKIKLNEIRENINRSHQYFRNNAERYDIYTKFVFDTSLSNDDRNKLAVLQKPQIEFNILEAMISRLRGEFSKHEPSVSVRASDGMRADELTPDFIRLMEVLEAHLRDIFFDASTDQIEYNIYSDLLAGGYSVVEVYMDYLNEKSFDQTIKVERVFDPTLTGFDPLARMSHKGDGEYCFQIFPRTKEEFEREYGKEATQSMNFSRENLGEFTWCYQDQKQQELLLVAHYYEKQRKKEKIVKLSNGMVVTKRQYDKDLKEWEDLGMIEQPPIILEERMSEFEVIHKYVVCETQVLEHYETNFKYLPLVFIDGNSVVIRNTENGASYQMTRPYVFHAMGIQKLKNFAGQSIANEIENLVQHKFKAAIESIPDEYLESYKNIQQADVLVYNAFYEKNPEVMLPPPMEIQRTPTPPIVENTFMQSETVTQTILGSYDALLGTNAQQVSGVAIQQGAMQTNAAAIPYLMGYIKGMNRIAQIIIDLIPKYYITPRTLPIKSASGKRSYQLINHKDSYNSVSMRYEPNNLQVKLEAGVNSAIQKQVALDQIQRMMQSSEIFSQFINTEGLEVLIDNMDIRGSDKLKEMATEFMNKMKQAQEQASQQQDPTIAIAQEQVQTVREVEMAKVQQREHQLQSDHAIKAAQVAIDQEKANVARMEALANIQLAKLKLGMDKEKSDAENARSAVEIAVDMADKLNRHPMPM